MDWDAVVVANDDGISYYFNVVAILFPFDVFAVHVYVCMCVCLFFSVRYMCK